MNKIQKRNLQISTQHDDPNLEDIKFEKPTEEKPLQVKQNNLNSQQTQTDFQQTQSDPKQTQTDANMPAEEEKQLQIINIINSRPPTP